MKLDPLPFDASTGRKPLGYIGTGTERVVFNPRAEYEQRADAYVKTTAEPPKTAAIYVDDLCAGDTILWRGEYREVTLVSRMWHDAVYFEMGPLSDVIARADDTVHVVVPGGPLT